MTRLLAEGEAIEIWGSEEQPDGFLWRGEPYAIEEICNRWQVHTRWWGPGEAIWRAYYKITTDQGMLCELYHDRLAGRWVLVRVYD